MGSNLQDAQQGTLITRSLRLTAVGHSATIFFWISCWTGRPTIGGENHELLKSIILLCNLRLISLFFKKMGIRNGIMF